MTRARLVEMAKFAVHLGIQPAAYFDLTWEQRTALLEEWNRANRKR